MAKRTLPLLMFLLLPLGCSERGQPAGPAESDAVVPTFNSIPTSCDFFDGFESGVIGSDWAIGPLGTPTVVTDAHSGTYSVRLIGDGAGGHYSYIDQITHNLPANVIRATFHGWMKPRFWHSAMTDIYIGFDPWRNNTFWLWSPTSGYYASSIPFSHSLPIGVWTPVQIVWDGTVDGGRVWFYEGGIPRLTFPGHGTTAGAFQAKARALANHRIEYLLDDVCINYEIANQPPVADVGPFYLGLVDVPIEFDGTGSSDPEGEPLVYDWDWGDGSQSPDAGPTPSHTYAEARYPYHVCLTVTDPGGLTDTDCRGAVVIDPDAGFVTGGGWIDSPEGAFKPDIGVSGKANFGFNAKYKKGELHPGGSAEFQFLAAGLNFHSSSYRLLWVDETNRAWFRGEGTVNGEMCTAPVPGVPYKFWIAMDDENPDRFGTKIWCENPVTFSDDIVLYQTPGVTQPLGGGSIVIHKGKK